MAGDAPVTTRLDLVFVEKKSRTSGTIVDVQNQSILSQAQQREYVLNLDR